MNGVPVISLWAKAAEILTQGQPCVMVEVTATQGSTPREAGAQMLVTPEGFHGTIGGGTLEWQAMAEAQKVLGQQGAINFLIKTLGPDLGQCCGGRVDLRVESLTEADLASVRQRAASAQAAKPIVHLWGAGHVGRALVGALAPLPFQVQWWDERPNAFPGYLPANVKINTGHFTAMIQPGFVVVMTHSHALDFAVVDYALRNPGFAQVGLIGSETKRARFISRLKQVDHGPENLSKLVCPIGSKAVGSKLPAAIAATAAVQLLEWQEVLKTFQLPLATFALAAKTGDS